MQIINLTEKYKLNEFIIRASGSFLESYEWGEFQEKIGGKIWRLGVEDDSGELIGAATLIKKRLPFKKSYFYCPKGPVINYQLSIINYQLVFDFLFREIKKIAEKENVIFLRFEPPVIIHNSLFSIHQTIDVQPSKTLILELTKLEEELLKEMHEKTRYNIRLAEKKGVKIIEGSLDRFGDFWNLLDQTSGRDKFRLHGRDYYEAMLGMNEINLSTSPRWGGAANTFLINKDAAYTPLRKGGEGGLIKLFFAEYEGKPIAAGIFSFFGDTAVYLHGGSSNEFRNVMAPYSLQWEVIKKAKTEGYKYYDFFGINEIKWPGVTRFKKGFGGKEINFPGTFDLVFNKAWYNIYRVVRKIKRKT